MDSNIGCYLSDDKEHLIDNIIAHLKSLPMYSCFHISKLHDDICTYILITDQDGDMINRFSFYGYWGELNSIAIYGLQLQRHLKAIKSSMTIFGIPVKRIFDEKDYLDIYVDNMKLSFDIEWYCKVAKQSSKNRYRDLNELIKQGSILYKEKFSNPTPYELYKQIAINAKEDIIKWYPWNLKDGSAITYCISLYCDAAIMANLSTDFDTLFKESFKYYIENMI